MVANSHSEVRLEFRGTPLQALGWILLSLVGGFLVVPLAWVNAAIARWVCRNTAFSDGATAEFRGTGGDVVVWHVLFMLVTGGQQLALLYTDPGDYGGIASIFTLSYFVMIAIVLTILKWFVYNVRLSAGPHLTFTGSLVGLLGWYVLIALSGITVVGWAWAAVAMYRWMARHVKGDGIAVEFRGTGFELLWRALATAVGSLLIVTVPFLAIWLTRWLVQNIVIIRGVETSWDDFIEKKKTPPPPSSPSGPTVFGPIG